MAMSDVTIVAADPAGATQEHHSYVDWAAIIAGIALASAISIVLLAFGSALGLTFVDFRNLGGTAPVWAAIAAASWLLWVEVSSFMAGGYLTGRMRRRFADATEHEVAVRDGAHGLLVWAGALVLGAVIAVGGLGAAFNAVGSAAATVTTAASNVADDAAEAVDPNAYFIDTLFRRPATSTGPATTLPAVASDSDFRGEAGRIFAAAAVSGELPAEDRTYLGQLVATNTGMTTEEANARVDQVVTAIDNAKAQAAAAAENARRVGVLVAFLTAASFLVSAAGAYWAASMGGRHRDEGTVFADVFRRY
ncbi:MAG: hypothetical protein ABIO40_10355 [Devosia sp.]